jgi:predicted N-formylglutamate amidohydrolase
MVTLSGDLGNREDMVRPWTDICGAVDSRILVIGDHASNHVPPGIDLCIPVHLLDTHIAIDLGVAPLAKALCTLLSCPAILGGVSRLVIDLNRETDAPGLIPNSSDGHAIPGNLDIVSDARVGEFWEPYHQNISTHITVYSPKLLVSLHSFTPSLSSRPEEVRPWEVGVLYNQDDRAARIAIPLLQSQGVIVGDQLPYSGLVLNATMNRHGEANGISYLGLEVRQDLISDADGIASWAARLATVIAACASAATP